MRPTHIVFTISLFLCACTQTSHTDYLTNCEQRAELQCVVKVLEQSDRQLAEIYQQIADRQEEEGVKRLALSQRNWYKFRDSYADFISLRETDADASQLQLIKQKTRSNLLRMQELTSLTKQNN